MNTSSQKQILHHSVEIVAIAPQMLRFRPRNQLLISRIQCGETQHTQVDLNFAYAAQFDGAVEFSCPCCRQIAPHYFGQILAVDLQICRGAKLRDLIQERCSDADVSLISIDWYGEDLPAVTANQELIQEIKDLAASLHDAFPNTIIVSHLSDYRDVICAERIDASTESYGVLERESFIGKYLSQQVLPLAAESKLVVPRIRHEEIKQSMAQAISAYLETQQRHNNHEIYRQDETEVDKFSAAAQICAWTKALHVQSVEGFQFTPQAAASLAQLLVSCEKIEIRDAILIYAVNSEISEITPELIRDASRYLANAAQSAPDCARIAKVIQRLSAIARYSIDSNVALYAAIAYLHWWADQPAPALENARYALQFKPDYSLAKLIHRAVRMQVPPPWQPEQSDIADLLADCSD